MTLNKSLSTRSEPTLVLLHGWGMNSGVWESLTELLNTDIKCMCIDLPGYGNSNRVEVKPEEYTLTFLSEWVEAKLPENTILLGWSLGGLIAQQIAINHARKLLGLICIASTPKFEETSTWPGIKPTILELFHRQLSGDHAKTLNRFLAIQMQGIADVSERKNAIRVLSKRLLSKPAPNRELLDAGLSLLSAVDLRGRVHEINVPTLRIYGRLDSLVPYAAIENIKKLHPKSETLIHQKASHAPFVTDCEKIYQDIVDFLQRSQLIHSIK